MNIFDSYIEAGHTMQQRDKESYYTALIEFLYYGVEPDLKGAALSVMTAIRPSLEESRTRIANGRKGGRQKKSQPTESEKANSRKSEKLNGENEESQPTESEKAKGKSKGKSINSSNEELNGRFKRPTRDEVARYAFGIGHPSFDTQKFMDYYNANGWKVGRNPMKDWQATVRNWIRRDEPQGKTAEASDYAIYD
jgi:hypothetical protein